MLEFVLIFINYYYKIIYIVSDGGRICWLMIIVEKGRLWVIMEYVRFLKEGKVIFDYFFWVGLVEYFDVNEENDFFIVCYENEIEEGIMYFEIELFIIFGVVVGLIFYFYYN